METLSNIFNAIHDNVADFATLKLTGAIALGCIGLLSLITFIFYSIISVRSRSGFALRIIKPLQIMIVYAISLGTLFGFNLAAPWDYSITELVLLSGITSGVALLVYFVVYRFIIIPIICFGLLIKPRKKSHGLKVKKIKSKPIKKAKTKSSDNKATEYGKDIEIMVSEHTRVWLKKYMKETGSNNRAEIMQAYKKDYIESTARTLESLCDNPNGAANYFYNKYLISWK